nr:DUF4381 domain-containing protein [Aestuariicella hydrocarbonica]
MHEVLLPAPLSHGWPAPGWWWLMFVVAWLGVGLCVRRYWHWKDNAYRRQACAAIRACRQSLQGQMQQQALAELQQVPALIRRVALQSVALAGLPRTQVSGLSANQWQQWLDLTGGEGRSNRHSLSAQPALAERFRSLAFVPLDTLASWPTDELAALLQWCDDWVRHHRVSRNSRQALDGQNRDEQPPQGKENLP